MKKIASKSGRKLTPQEAAMVKAMLKRGDRQHDIAAFFNVNGGRVGEIATGDKFSEIRAAEVEILPPPGPYVPGPTVAKARHALLKAQIAVNMGYYEAAQSAIEDALGLVCGRTTKPDNQLPLV